MSDIRAEDLTEETLASLSGSEYFVMFDNIEGKKTPLSVIADYVAAHGTIDSNDLPTILEAIKSMIAEEYDTSSAYAVGDLVWYENALYACTTATSAGAFNPSKWTQTDVATVLAALDTSVAAVDAKIGNLASLTTTAKTNVVAAINELKSGEDDLKEDINDITSDLSDYLPIANSVEPTLMQDGYISYTSGNVATLTGATYTDYVEITKGNKYTISGIAHTPSDLSGLAVYNSSKTFVEGHQYDSTNSYSFVADFGGYIRCTVWNDITITEEEPSLNNQKVSALEYKVENINKKYIYPKQADIMVGKYVNLDGNLGNDAASITAYRMDISEAQGKMIHFNARVLSSYAVVLQNDELNRYLLCFNGSTASAYGITPQFYAQEIKFVVPKDAQYLSYTYPSTNPSDLYCYYDDDYEETQPIASMSLFNKIGVIGDSYASGEIYVNGTARDVDEMSWGKIIAKKCGINCELYARGGLNTRTWFTSPYGYTKFNSADADNLYVLALGINDAAEGASYLGTESDMDEEEKPDTFYGNYAKIIELINAKSTVAKMVILTFRPTGQMNTMRSNYNYAIRKIAEHYNIPLIDLTLNPYFNSNFYQVNMNVGHPVGINYSGMATEIQRLAEIAMESNASYFFDYRPTI